MIKASWNFVARARFQRGVVADANARRTLTSTWGRGIAGEGEGEEDAILKYLMYSFPFVSRGLGFMRRDRELRSHFHTGRKSGATEPEGEREREVGDGVEAG